MAISISAVYRKMGDFDIANLLWKYSVDAEREVPRKFCDIWVSTIPVQIILGFGGDFLRHRKSYPTFYTYGWPTIKSYLLNHLAENSTHGTVCRYTHRCRIITILVNFRNLSWWSVHAKGNCKDFWEAYHHHSRWKADFANCWLCS